MRLLRVIQAFKQNNINGLALSIGAAKAYDRWWSHLFYCLNKFSLGNNFIRWIRILNGNCRNQANQCLQVATERHKISLYTDDDIWYLFLMLICQYQLYFILLIYLATSLVIKINLAKSENVPLGSLNAIPAALPSTPQVVSSRFPVPKHIYNP